MCERDVVKMLWEALGSLWRSFWFLVGHLLVIVVISAFLSHRGVDFALKRSTFGCALGLCFLCLCRFNEKGLTSIPYRKNHIRINVCTSLFSFLCEDLVHNFHNISSRSQNSKNRRPGTTFGSILVTFLNPWADIFACYSFFSRYVFETVSNLVILIFIKVTNVLIWVESQLALWQIVN